MTTPTPDVREIAAKALSNEIDDGFLSWNGCLALADAVLVAVTSVLRQQVAEEIAQAIEELDEMSLACHWTVTEAAATARDHAPTIAAVARSHVQHRTED